MPNGDQNTVNPKIIVQRVTSCSHLSNYKHKKCVDDLFASMAGMIEENKAVIKENTAESEARNNSQDKVILSLSFIVDTGLILQSNANKVNEALNAANTNFKDILSRKDFNWGELIFDVIWSVGNVFVPALGTALLPLKAWRNNTLGGGQTKFKLFLGKSLERAGNFSFNAATTIKDQLTKVEVTQITGGDVISNAKAEVQRNLDLAVFFMREFRTFITENIKNMPPNYDIEQIWNEGGLGDYGKPMPIDTKELSDLFLYLLLKEYVNQKCKFIRVRDNSLNQFEFTGPLPRTTPSYAKMPSEFNKLDENSATYGRIKGLSLSARMSIYELYGSSPKSHKYLWLGMPPFPRIGSYKDMLQHWGLGIELE